VSVNADGKLKYRDFLKTFNAEAVTMPSDTPDANNPASASNCSTPAEPGSHQPHTAVAWSPPLLNCEPIANKIRKNIQHSWREILKECKEKDVSQLGEIPVSDFSAIAEKFNLDLSKEEFSQITTKYDIKNNGKFTYYDFFRCCVLSLKPQGSSVLQRMVVQKSREPSLTFFKAMLKIQPQSLYCWRPMRQSFKSYDKSGTGLLNTQDFKQVLHEYSVNLSEEEFFHILEFYDKALTSKASYNNFLQAFLQ
uniref:EF-hand domain-containing protein n=1 Tax=Crocodylus porosus TaxID=8502 RepID=A0A7M4E4P0_CROPO